jgi:hypothetical protein
MTNKQKTMLKMAKMESEEEYGSSMDEEDGEES